VGIFLRGPVREPTKGEERLGRTKRIYRAAKLSKSKGWSSELEAMARTAESPMAESLPARRHFSASHPGKRLTAAP